MTSSRRKVLITARIAVVIFAVEALIMELMPEGLPAILETFLDATSLTLLSSPIIYYWVIAPYVRIRDQAEAMLANLQVQREQTLAQAEETARVKTQFMANMSHELRTPMTAILGMVDLALAGETIPRQRGYLTKVQRASHHLLALVNNVLDFSKADAGEVELERVPFELDDVLEQLALLTAGRAEERKIPLVWIVAPEVPRRLVGDPTRLGQVLLNLVGNALKFSDRGTVAVELRWEDSRLHGVVRDEGIGMTPAQCARLFRPFTQADASTNRRFGGTGLGLVISKNLVELMGGEIQVESELGRGTSFHFTVCVEVAPSDPAREPAELAAALTHLAGAPIAVVVTHAPSRDVLVTQLAALGLSPVACATFDDAVALAARSPLAAAFLDSWLPDLVPTTFGERLRAPTYLLGLHDVSLPAEVTTVLRPTTLSQLHAAMAPRSAEPAPAAKDRTLEGTRVLVVDDVELNRELLAELLAGEGVDVQLATDGAEAIEKVLADRPDAVLMDNQMPVLDGAEATRRLRADVRFRDLPIISITANADAETKACMSAAGANETLAKPINQAALFATLARWIAPRTRVVPDAGVQDPAPVQTAVVKVPVEEPAPEEPALEPPVTPLPALPGVDVAAGLAAVGGKPALYTRLLATFGGQLDDLDGELILAVAGADWSAAARAAHAIKGAARTLGANEIGDRAAAVEAATRDASQDPLDAIEALRAAAHQLRPALA